MVLLSSLSKPSGASWPSASLDCHLRNGKTALVHTRRLDIVAKRHAPNIRAPQVELRSRASQKVWVKGKECVQWPPPRHYPGRSPGEIRWM